MCRKTVRKLLGDSQKPTYTLKEPRPRPVTGPYLEVIRAWLVEDLQAPRKQRHTARRVYDRLVAERGFKGSESIVRKIVAEIKKEIAPKKGFLPLEAAPGEQAQVDWGEAVVRLGGEERRVHLFCMRLRHSGTPFVHAFPDEGLEAFLAGHRLAFEFFGGVPKECVYDNLKSAVTKVLKGPHREENRHFSALRSHYLFDSAFCNPRSGHEKGAVEHLVGYVRRNVLVLRSRLGIPGGAQPLSEPVVRGAAEEMRGLFRRGGGFPAAPPGVTPPLRPSYRFGGELHISGPV